MKDGVALLRRNKDFRRLYFASLISNGGDWFALIPLLALLHELTGSGLYGGLVLAADTAVFALFSPYAGTVADRFDRKRLLAAAEATCAVFALLLLLVGDGTAWLSVLAIGAIAAAKAFATPSISAAIPNLVAPADLATATVMNAVAWGSMLAVGAALGGLLTALVGTTACFLLDAGSFLVSALLIWSCRTPFQQPREVGLEHPRFRAAIKAAVTYARSDHAVLALLAAKPGIAFANGSLVLFPLLAADVFGVGSSGLGLMYAARGLGVLAGPLVLGRRGREEPALWSVLALGTFACGILYVAVALSPWFWLVLLLIAMAHVGGGSNWTVTTYGLQRRVPDAVRGRIASADAMAVTLAIAVNQALAGVLSDVVAPRTLVACFGGASVVYAVGWYAATRNLRRVPSTAGA